RNPGSTSIRCAKLSTNSPAEMTSTIVRANSPITNRFRRLWRRGPAVADGPVARADLTRAGQGPPRRPLANDPEGDRFTGLECPAAETASLLPPSNGFRGYGSRLVGL